MFLRVLIFVFLSTSLAFGWGRRGHELTSFVAANVLADKTDHKFLRTHSFDLGYYSNIPDILYRGLSPTANDIEGPQHFVDWDSKTRDVFKKTKDLPVDFQAYKKAMGADYSRKDGLSPWRISQLVNLCKSHAEQISREKQGPLLVCLGLLSHYVADLSMPLHNSRNYNGQMSGQKGVHSYFEEKLVDQLEPELRVKVEKAVRKDWARFESKKLDIDGWVRWLIDDGFSDVEPLLKLDKKISRKDLKAAASRFESLLVKRLSIGALVLAQIWKQILKDVNAWDSEKFYFFDHKPEYIQPSYEDVK